MNTSLTLSQHKALDDLQKSDPRAVVIGAEHSTGQFCPIVATQKGLYILSRKGHLYEIYPPETQGEKCF